MAIVSRHFKRLLISRSVAIDQIFKLVMLSLEQSSVYLSISVCLTVLPVSPFQAAPFQRIPISKRSWEQGNCLCITYSRPTRYSTLRYHWTASYNHNHTGVSRLFIPECLGIRFVIAVAAGGLLPGPVLHRWSTAVTHGGGGCLQHAQVSHVRRGAAQAIQAGHDHSAGKECTRTYFTNIGNAHGTRVNRSTTLPL